MFLVAWDVHYWRAEISPIVLALEQQGLAVYLKPVLTEVCQWLKIGTRIFTISALRETGLESSNLMRALTSQNAISGQVILSFNMF